MVWSNAEECSQYLGDLAVRALIDEAELTPKPGLVDQVNTGAHKDLTLNLMIRSANALHQTFSDIAYVSYQQKPNQSIREEVGRIGRIGEKMMFDETGGTNTHKGAIWALGLLVASAAMQEPGKSVQDIALVAGKLACYSDRFIPNQSSNGIRVQKKFGVNGAKGEAQQGFPHILNIGLPALQSARQKGLVEKLARLDALVTLIATLDDTCILHRGGAMALTTAKEMAHSVIKSGGASTKEGWNGISLMDRTFIELNISPGGSADLLAGTLFLDDLLALCFKKHFSEHTLQV